MAILSVCVTVDALMYVLLIFDRSCLGRDGAGHEYTEGGRLCVLSYVLFLYVVVEGVQGSCVVTVVVVRFSPQANILQPSPPLPAGEMSHSISRLSRILDIFWWRGRWQQRGGTHRVAE